MCISCLQNRKFDWIWLRSCCFRNQWVKIIWLNYLTLMWLWIQWILDALSACKEQIRLETMKLNMNINQWFWNIIYSKLQIVFNLGHKNGFFLWNLLYLSFWRASLMVFLIFYEKVFLKYLKTEIEKYKWINLTLMRWIPLSLLDFALYFVPCSDGFRVNKSDR